MTPTKDISTLRKVLSFGLLGFGCSCLFVLDRVDIVMNASHSLEDPAFLMLEHPVLLKRGALVSAEMPRVLRQKYGQMHFVKAIGGLPGEEITLDDAGNPCIGNNCYPLLWLEGEPVAPALSAGVIPDDHFAIFGTSADSLDSRYAAIGLIHRDQLLGRGIAVSWAPDWRD